MIHAHMLAHPQPLHPSPCTHACLGICLLPASLSASCAHELLLSTACSPSEAADMHRSGMRQISVYCRAVNGPGCLSVTVG